MSLGDIHKSKGDIYLRTGNYSKALKMYEKALPFIEKAGKIGLVGLLMTPYSPGTHPAVVFIHGSGESIRDYPWYLHLADYLAQHGIAVLLPDKPGSLGL